MAEQLPPGHDVIPPATLTHDARTMSQATSLAHRGASHSGIPARATNGVTPMSPGSADVERDMHAKNLADLCGTPIIDWTRVQRRLDEGVDQAPGAGGPDRHTCWLAKIDADGRPHVTGIGVLWSDGAFWFETGRTSRKGRNIERNPRCTLSIALDWAQSTLQVLEHCWPGSVGNSDVFAAQHDNSGTPM